MSHFSVIFISIHTVATEKTVPLGAASVASAAKAACVDAGYADIQFSLVEAGPEESPQQLASRIAAAKPDLVAFSLYVWNRHKAIACAQLLRAAQPELPLWCGGPEASTWPQGLSQEDGGPFDLLISGEGEQLFSQELLALLATRSGQTPAATTSELASGAAASAASSQPFDLSKLPSPWLDGTLSPAGRKSVLWELVRGCPFSCAYCYEGRGSRQLRHINPQRLEAELALFSSVCPDEVQILDPTFNVNNERAIAILDRLIKEDSPIHWHFEVRAEQLTRSQAKRFARLNCSLQIGLQSADEAVCAALGRPLKRGLFADKITLLNEEGVSFGLDLIYGLPGDTYSGYRRSLDFALSLYPDNLDMFQLSVLPGTELYEKAESLQLRFMDSAPWLLLESPKFPATDIQRAERLSKAADLFYNQGRAVGWFNQVLYPLQEEPSAFMEGFAAYLASGASGRTADTQGAANGRSGVAGAAKNPVPKSVELEHQQLDFLSQRYEKARLDHLLPLVWDIVRCHGAWSRALAEGISSDIEFNYNPFDILGGAVMDIEEYVSLAEIQPAWYRMQAGQTEPALVRL